MSVNPGFGGQSFIDNQVKKISDLRRMCDEKGLDPWIEVDGGVKGANAWKVIEAGANAIVSGSGVFNQPDYAAAIQGIRNSKRPSWFSALPEKLILAEIWFIFVDLCCWAGVF